jgi:hypothetical protein
MAIVDMEGFSRRLRNLLSDEAEHLLDYTIQLMDQEIAEGWRAFYAPEIWFRQELPPPLLNDLGRQYMTEQLREAIWTKVGQGSGEYASVFLRQFFDQPALREGYRNFLNVGSLDIVGFGGIPFDKTADAVVTRKLAEENRHMWYETRANADNWYVESGARATLTPPWIGLPHEEKSPMRNPAVQLAQDGNYWRAVYPVAWRIVMNADDYPALTKPQCNLDLMSKIAPDFPYAAALSTAKRLIFVQEGEGDLAWALMIDKTDGSSEYRYPPQLILIDRRHSKKLKDEHIIFLNVIGKYFPSFARGPRGLETELLFHIPRSRRLINFYTPFVASAMAEADA